MEAPCDGLDPCRRREVMAALAATFRCVAIAVVAVPPFGWTPVAPPGIVLPLREFLLHVAAPVECAVPSPVPTVPRAARAVVPDGVAAPVRITALVAIDMAAHYLPISPSNAAYVKTRPPPRVRAPRDAFATLVEPEESGGRRRGVIPRGRLKDRCDGSVGSVWVFVALSRGTRASEPAVGAHGAEFTRADEDAVIQFFVLLVCFGGIVRHNQMRIRIPIPKGK